MVIELGSVSSWRGDMCSVEAGVDLGFARWLVE